VTIYSDGSRQQPEDGIMLFPHPDGSNTLQVKCPGCKSWIAQKASPERPWTFEEYQGKNPACKGNITKIHQAIQLAKHPHPHRPETECWWKGWFMPCGWEKEPRNTISPLGHATRGHLRYDPKAA